MIADDHDSWEGSFWDAGTPTAIKAQLRIRYLSAADQLTEREVTIKQFDLSSPAGLMLAHCHLRDATRTFRIDRVEQAVDMETGEIITDPHRWLVARHKASPAGTLDQLFADRRDTLLALLYIGKADGRFTQAEKTVVAGWAAKATVDPRIDAAAIHALLGDMGSPSRNQFRACVRRVATGAAAEKAALLATANDIVRTQKKVALSEADALEYLKEQLTAA